MTELSPTTMKLNSSLHIRLNVDIILITVLHENMKARKREHQLTNCHDT